MLLLLLLLSLCSLYASSFSSLNEDTHFVILSFSFRKREKERESGRTIISTEEAYRKYSCSDADVVVVVCLLFAKHFRVFPLPFSVKTDDHQSEYVYVFYICVYKNPMCPKEEIKCVVENEQMLHRCQAYIRNLSVCSKAITLKFDFQIVFKTMQSEKKILMEMK